MTPEASSHKVLVGGRRIAYDEVTPVDPAGTVLFLTGLGGTRVAWRAHLPVFGRRYRALSLDHRDSGDSDPVEADYTTADQADDAAGLLQALGAAPAHIVGLSMGGFVALNLAVRHPSLVRSLTLVATSAGGASHVPPDPAGLESLRPDFTLRPAERALTTFRLITAPGWMDAHPELAARMAANAEAQPLSPAGYARQFRSTRTHDVTGQLAQVQVPTLVLHGDADPLVRYENGQHLARHIPGARLLTYPGTGHLPQLERFTDFNRDVLAFLATT
ncbi:alpha/beta fold hydrolase [Deinococcus navajonensis]|uniref:Alpha/beta fold hydrolase n=1 Tax=Deinococcus navajonensis TaxID=309884 RepID=A0ABV8XJI6_9DEIO